jgi:hypothetical protein
MVKANCSRGPFSKINTHHIGAFLVYGITWAMLKIEHEMNETLEKISFEGTLYSSISSLLKKTKDITPTP